MLAALVAFALGAWVWTRATRVHRAATPRYVKATPLPSQGGIAGHAALIAAKPTTRALAVLEIKTALEEQICAALELDRAPAPDEIIRRAKGKNLMSERIWAALLRALLRVHGRRWRRFVLVLAPRGGDADVVTTRTSCAVRPRRGR